MFFVQINHIYNPIRLPFFFINERRHGSNPEGGSCVPHRAYRSRHPKIDNSINAVYSTAVLNVVNAIDAGEWIRHKYVFVELVKSICTPKITRIDKTIESRENCRPTKNYAEFRKFKRGWFGNQGVSSFHASISKQQRCFGLFLCGSVHSGRVKNASKASREMPWRRLYAGSKSLVSLLRVQENRHDCSNFSEHESSVQR